MTKKRSAGYIPFFLTGFIFVALFSHVFGGGEYKIEVIEEEYYYCSLGFNSDLPCHVATLKIALYVN